VKAYLLFSGTPAINDTVPVVFDTSLKLWIGTYTVKPADTGGLWSLVVKAADSPTPPNTGSATRAITVQNTTGGNASFPLYFFGIIAALLALLLVAVFLLFRRRKVTHARLKIDLDAVRSEAGRIESTDFFQSVKDQVKKEKE
jgi:LPXTG-motif cell wall-anchored protein